MYTGNYPGSSSGYDPNVPLGTNKWDEEEFLEPRPSIPEQENDYEDEMEYPRNEFRENTVIVENKNNGEMNCSNEVDKKVLPND